MSENAKAGEAQRWDVPAIDGGGGNGYMTAGRLEALQEQAYREAWDKGHADGLAAGAAELEARVGRLGQLLEALANPFDDLDDELERQLVDLAMAVVRQLFRREIDEQPSHVIGVVREAIQLLPAASRSVQVHLHPDDATLVREFLSPSDGEPAWIIVEDPLLTRGGCRVTTESSRVDASAEARLEKLIQSIAGDRRR